MMEPFSDISRFIVGLVVPASNTASAALQEYRLKRCLAPCMYLRIGIEGSQYCKLCTCPVKSKATVKSESCPDNRW